MRLLAVVLLSVVSRAEKRPNVVVFIADDLGYGDVGAFGNKTLRTPHLDELAASGTKLTHHLAAESVCTPSRAALFTGRYPIRSGMAAEWVLKVILFLGSSAGLPPNETTFATLAQQQGYNTALIGKWHLGVSCSTYGDWCHYPTSHGFDYFFGTPLTNLEDFGGETTGFYKYQKSLFYSILASSVLACSLSLLMALNGRSKLLVILFFIIGGGFGYVFVLFQHLGPLNNLLMRGTEVVEQPIRFENLSSRLVGEADTFLDNVAAEAPFLLVVSWLQVHTVLHAEPPFRGSSQHGSYGDSVEELDASVGAVMTSLKRRNLLENTFVYFVSDNGAHLEERSPSGERQGGDNGPLRGGKTHGAVEGGVRVPAIVSWPGTVPPGGVVEQPTSMMDMFSTITSLVGAAQPSDRLIDGENILPLLIGETSEPPHEFLFHYCDRHLHGVTYTPEESRGSYKLYYAVPQYLEGKEECEFVCDCGAAIWLSEPRVFHISSDISERRPLVSTDAVYLAVVAAVNVAVEEHRATMGENSPSEFSLSKILWNPRLQPCCNWPLCSCYDREAPPSGVIGREEL